LTFQAFKSFKGNPESVPMTVSTTKPGKTPAAKGGTTR
jgi:hypothetical protein